MRIPSSTKKKDLVLSIQIEESLAGQMKTSSNLIFLHVIAEYKNLLKRDFNQVIPLLLCQIVYRTLS